MGNHSGLFLVNTFILNNVPPYLAPNNALSAYNEISPRSLPLFPRIREITDAFGARLRVSIERHPGGALVILEHPDQLGPPRVMFDCYGAELLTGFIMAARLALPHGLTDEVVAGAFPSRFSLARGSNVALCIAQRGRALPFAIMVTFWDRLYAELCMVVAHARELERGTVARIH
jgi:hypothetical protein